MKNNTQRSHMPFTQLLPIVISFRINTEQTSNAITTRSLRWPLYSHSHFLPTPAPSLTPGNYYYGNEKSVLHFHDFVILRIIEHVTFGDWPFFPLSLILSRFIQVAYSYINTLFLSSESRSPLCMYHSLFNHSPTGQHTYFQFCTIKNKNSMNIDVQMFV